MLLTKKSILKQVPVLLLGASVLFIAGCSSKYTNNYGYSSSKSTSSSSTYKKDRSSIKVGPQKIRNSKAMHRATMRPYVVFGKKYYPTLAKVGDTHTGISSWYGPNFHAKKTSNGETYNMYASTAAHKTLPMNTMLRVDNLENGKSVVVRINDRGPFVGTRIIDLSNKAARAIDMVAKGTANVKITVLGFNAKIATTQEEKKQTASVASYYLQVGAFRRLEGAIITQRKFKLIVENGYDVIIKEDVLNEEEIHRVFISGFRSQEEAIDYKNNNDLSTSTIIAK